MRRNAHDAFSFCVLPFNHQASVACIPSVALHLPAPVVFFIAMASPASAATRDGPFTTIVAEELTFFYEADGALRGIQWFSRDHRTYLFLTPQGVTWVWARSIYLEDFAYTWMTLPDWFARGLRIPRALCTPILE